jgi:hypothetical protein
MRCIRRYGFNTCFTNPFGVTNNEELTFTIYKMIWQMKMGSHLNFKFK